MSREIRTEVVGIYYERGTIRGIKQGDVLRVVREPSNPYDSNAVRVEIWDGELLGRIPRQDAQVLSPLIVSAAGAFAVVVSTSAARKPHPARCHVIVHIVSDRSELPDFSSKPPRRSLPSPPVTTWSKPLEPDPLPLEIRVTLRPLGSIRGLPAGSILRVIDKGDGSFVVERPTGEWVGGMNSDESARIKRSLAGAAGAFAVVAYRSEAPGLGSDVCEVKIRVVAKSEELPNFSESPVVLPATFAPAAAPKETPLPKPLPPAPQQPTESRQRPTSSCFVATAVFCDAAHPTVRQLQDWRDSVLMRRALGRVFVAIYYRIGPSLAGIFSLLPFLRRPMAVLLEKIASHTRT